MKEALFKIIIFIITLNFCFSSDLNLSSYDFVNIDIVPLEISKNNFGIRNSNVSEENRFFFQSQNWVAENLYLFGSFSPSLKGNINIIYNVNVGYQKKIENKNFKNIIYDFGYYYKRFEDEEDRHKWVSFSMIGDIIIRKIHFLPSLTYIFNNTPSDKLSKSFLTLDFLKDINKNLLFKFGFKLYKETDYEAFPFISIKYKI